MNKITWFPLYGDQECSYRLGYKDEKTDSYGCQEVYDIAWAAVKKMVKEWSFLRPPHYDELHCVWYGTPLNKPFRSDHRSFEIVNEAQKEIITFYKKHLKRKPNRNELMGAFRQCFIKPGFKFNWEIKSHNKSGKCTTKYLIENYEKRKRDDDNLILCDMVEISKCVICGKPVFVTDNHLMLHYAGEISMHFGYGSQRDIDYGKGYIHDLCSAKLDQQVFKNRLNWGKHGNGHKIDIKNSKIGSIKVIKMKDHNGQLD
jgi:hypothetical protein